MYIYFRYNQVCMYHKVFNIRTVSGVKWIAMNYSPQPQSKHTTSIIAMHQSLWPHNTGWLLKSCAFDLSHSAQLQAHGCRCSHLSYLLCAFTANWFWEKHVSLSWCLLTQSVLAVHFVTRTSKQISGFWARLPLPWWYQEDYSVLPVCRFRQHRVHVHCT
jgi:hypothetical protein